MELKKGTYYRHKTDEDIIYVMGFDGNFVIFRIIEDPRNWWGPYSKRQTSTVIHVEDLNGLDLQELKHYESPLWRAIEGKKLIK
jgi:hypothetical protein